MGSVLRRVYITGLIVISAAVALQSSAQPAVTDKTVSVSATATRPVTPGPLVDDFRYAAPVNLWNDRTATFYDDATIAVSYVSDPSLTLGGSGNSLKLDYTLPTAEGYSGYLTSLGSVDIRSYNHLSFWVKGAAGGEFFKIMLTNNSTDKNRSWAGVYITDYLDGGVTTSWQKVSIPLDAFANITDLTSMKNIQIVFENYQSSANGSPLSGTVYIDDISLGTQFLGYVKVNPFSYRGVSSDGNILMPLNSMGGQSNAASWNDAGGSAYLSSGTYYSAPYSMRLYFQGMKGGTDRWMASYFIIGGGDNGWTEVPRNLSRYSKIKFAVRGEGGSEKSIRVEMKNASGTYYNIYSGGITSSWKNAEINFANIKEADYQAQPIGDSIDVSTVMKVSFVYTFWNAYLGGVDTGAVYVDDIRFESDSYSKDIVPPATPSAPEVTTVAGSKNSLMLTSQAGYLQNDPSMSSVAFQYKSSSGWVTIASDYDIADSAYSVVWDITPVPSGSYQLRAVACDAAGNQSISPVITYAILKNEAPQAVSVTPPSGSSQANTVTSFAAIFSDNDGAADIKNVMVLVNTSSVYAGGVAVFYNAGSNLLYLSVDNGNSFIGGYAPGSANTIENSAAKIDCSAVTVSRSGNNLTLNFNLNFKAAFTGAKNLYLYAQDKANAESGWIQKGTWTVTPANVAPQAVSIAPAGGSSQANAAVSFTAVFSDSDGAADIKTAMALVNSGSSYAGGAAVYYNALSNLVYLSNDAGNSFIGGYAPGSANTIENSAAKIDCSAVTVSSSGNNLTLNFNLNFKAAFTGAKNLYLYAQDKANAESGWIQKGTWTVTPGNIPPTLNLSVLQDRTIVAGTTLSFTVTATPGSTLPTTLALYPAGDITHDLFTVAVDTQVIQALSDAGARKGYANWNPCADLNNDGVINTADLTVAIGLINAGKKQLPAGINFDSATGSFSWTPTSAQAGTWLMTFVASNGPNEGKYMDARTVAITVNAASKVPSAPVASGSGSVTLTSNCVSSATDPSIRSVRFDYYNGTSWVVIGTDSNTSDSAYSVSWNRAAAGTVYNLRAVAIDSNGAEYVSPNTAPVLAPSSVQDRTVAAGATLSFTVSAGNSYGFPAMLSLYPAADVSHDMYAVAMDSLIIKSLAEAVTSKGGANWNPCADLNNDGVINTADLAIATTIINNGRRQLPSGIVFNAATGSFSWTPTASYKGTWLVTFVASNGPNEGKYMDARTVAITVTA